SLTTRATNLLEGMLNSYDEVLGGSSMSASVYDTAWISLIIKTIDGSPQWLFPESFNYLLDTQETSGAWPTYASQTDGILNTSAALLSLCKHIKNPHQLDLDVQDLQSRLTKAKLSLQEKLEVWDVPASTHVGFEVLVPAMLDFLEVEGIAFEFRGKDPLMKIRSAKLAKLSPEILYSSERTTALHSLEAFIGKINFDRIRHHKVFGSMMASPSSTAAYLMESSTWDEESEMYLHRVVKGAKDRGIGGVPSAFPSHFFELSWVVTTLLDVGFTREELGMDITSTIGSMLKSELERGSGLIGFASYLEPDGDDTAKCICALSALGIRVTPDKLIQEFGGEVSFETFHHERNAKISTNCNVLLALLSGDANHYRQHIEKVIRFLCGIVWKNHDKFTDQWNLSSYYPIMLLCQAFTKAINASRTKNRPLLLDRNLKGQMSIILFQILIRLLRARREDGSWEDSPEPTAYATLALQSLTYLESAQTLSREINGAIKGAQVFITAKTENEFQATYVWIEKVTYKSNILAQVYAIAALKAPGCELTQTCLSNDCNLIQKQLVGKYSHLPLLFETPCWLLTASLTEGDLFTTQLAEICQQILPESKVGGKHLKFIPFTWTVSNHISNSGLSASCLLDMMTFSALLYAMDHYMESVVMQLSRDDRFTIRQSVLSIFRNMDHISEHLAESKIDDPIKRFILFLWDHPNVRRASRHEKRQVTIHLLDYLLGHLAQLEDNIRRAQPQHNGNCKVTKSHEWLYDTHGSILRWLGSTSGPHTGGNIAFAFFTCLMHAQYGHEPFATTLSQYVSEDLAHHMSILSRLYNDYGSITRDMEEGNINTADFLSLQWYQGSSLIIADDPKQQLLSLARYEKMTIGSIIQQSLSPLVSEAVLNGVNVFFNAVEMYGQMYVMKDHTPRMK
ncbi:Ent-kaurene synthase, partial [Patellaria atrata CBS 101060]